MSDWEQDRCQIKSVCPGCFSGRASLSKPSCIVELFCNYSNKQLYLNVIALTENILMWGSLFRLLLGKFSITLSHLFWIFKRFMSSYSTDILLHIRVLVILFCSCILVCLFTLVYLNREGGNLERVGRVHRLKGRTCLCLKTVALYFFRFLLHVLILNSDTIVKWWKVQENPVYPKKFCEFCTGLEDPTEL